MSHCGVSLFCYTSLLYLVPICLPPTPPPSSSARCQSWIKENNVLAIVLRDNLHQTQVQSSTCMQIALCFTNMNVNVNVNTVLLVCFLRALKDYEFCVWSVVCKTLYLQSNACTIKMPICDLCICKIKLAKLCYNYGP